MYPRKLDPNKCPTIVETAGLRMSFHQCCLPVVKDGFCRVHHPDAVKKRRDAAMARQEENHKNSPWQKLAAAHDRINALTKEVERLKRKLKQKPTRKITR